MQTALEHYGEIDRADLATLDAIRGWLHELPDKGHPCNAGSHLWSCHAVVRAAQRRFGLWEFTVVDGWFGRTAFDHSWLARPARNERRGEVILDVSPVASAGGPLLLFSGTWNSPWTDLYGVSGPKDRYKGRVDQFCKDAEALLACS